MIKAFAPTMVGIFIALMAVAYKSAQLMPISFEYLYDKLIGGYIFYVFLPVLVITLFASLSYLLSKRLDFPTLGCISMVVLAYLISSLSIAFAVNFVNFKDYTLIFCVAIIAVILGVLHWALSAVVAR